MIVPIPILENGENDWRVVQEVVYDIKKVHQDFVSRGQYPVDFAFEARLMAGSDLVMSSQYGNQVHYIECSCLNRKNIYFLCRHLLP